MGKQEAESRVRYIATARDISFLRELNADIKRRLRNAMPAARVAPEEAVYVSKKFHGLDQEA